MEQALIKKVYFFAKSFALTSCAMQLNGFLLLANSQSRVVRQLLFVLFASSTRPQVTIVLFQAYFE